MDKQLKRCFLDAVRTAWQAQLADGKAVAAAEVETEVWKRLNADPVKFRTLREQIFSDAVRHVLQADVRQFAGKSNPDQSWLPLPGCEHIQSFVRSELGLLDIRRATLEQYRVDTAALGKKIKDYAYSRRSEESLKRDKQEYRERRRLDPMLAPYFANAPEMTIGRAAELHAEYLKTPAMQSKSKGGKAKNARYRKSTT